MLLDSYASIYVAGNFPNCLQMIEQITDLRPDVILMDIQMPGISGIEAVKQINKFFPEIKIIMQTVFEDEEKIFDALRFGAGGYLLKKDNPEKIVSAIEDVMQGGAPMTDATRLIDLQIMWNRLIAVVEEQAQTLMRTAFSPIVRECGDLSAGVFDLQGRMLGACDRSVGWEIGVLRVHYESVSCRPFECSRTGQRLLNTAITGMVCKRSR